MEKINLYEKLARARADFLSANIKKTGQNKFVGFDYYELHDIIPKINELSLKYKFICMITFHVDRALLVIGDMENPEQSLTFESPMAEANLKGAHAIQNLGAVQTYMRRYLYMLAFEIVECDTLDGNINTNGKNDHSAHEHKKDDQAPSQLNMNNEKNKIGEEIKKVLGALDDFGEPSYFDDDKIEAERNIFKLGDTKAALAQLRRLNNELAKKQGAANDINRIEAPMSEKMEIEEQIKGILNSVDDFGEPYFDDDKIRAECNLFKHADIRNAKIQRDGLSRELLARQKLRRCEP